MSFQSTRDYVLQQIEGLVNQSVHLKRHCFSARVHGLAKEKAEAIQAELKEIGVFLADVTIKAGEATSSNPSGVGEAYAALNEPAKAEESHPYRSAHPGQTLKQRLDAMKQQLAGFPV